MVKSPTARRRNTRVAARRGLSSPAAAGRLERAPVVEALVDLRVDPPSRLTVDKLARIHKRIQAEYPVSKTRMVASGHFDLSNADAPTAVASTAVDGWRFESRDHTRVLQARVDGFTYSQLKPYRNWKTLRSEAERLWRFYVAVAKPKRVKRVALRFINRIELPPTGKLNDWLLTGPDMIDGMPMVSDFFMRVTFPLQANKAFAIITEAVDRQSDDPSTFPVILDIDIFREEQFPADGDQIWALLDEFRRTKNDLFFKSITERTRRLFE